MPPTPPKAPSAVRIIQNRDSYSQHSTHSEANTEEPEELTFPLTVPPYLYEEEPLSSVSTFKLVYDSVTSFLNMAKQRGSRVNDAWVQDVIALLKAPPRIKRTGVGNLTQKLTVKQYGEVLRAIGAENEAFPDNIRFDYTRSKKLFENRVPTTMQGGVEDCIKRRTFIWHDELEQSLDANVSNAAKTILGCGHANVSFPYPRGASDTKSPDWSIKHNPCRLCCMFPVIVMEIGWTQTKKDLQEKAEKYTKSELRSSKGKIRTVVSVFMREMYLAELRNEERLEELYLHNELDATEWYSYEDDERNTTGKASIMIWRVKTSRNGNVKASCYQDEVFRDETGNAVELCSLHLPLQDFICQGLLDSPEGNFKAPLLEISSKHLCNEIVNILKVYRQERAPVIIEKAENKKKKQLEAAEMESRERSKAPSSCGSRLRRK
ncbi:hypothetical protein ANO14919_113620 [Xylariales sp. No.14919]|nr:hypothetical protein ANO14919_113620 [Xylariales sp. No.14919]